MSRAGSVEGPALSAEMTVPEMPGIRDYTVNFIPASRDPGIAMPGSQLAGLKFFHVIAKLIFSAFHRPAEIPANRASPAKRASPPHVIGP